jgi:hypothetical protein
MSYNLILNNTNVVSASNTIFQYKFINGGFFIPEGSEICIGTMSIPYAFFNITTANNNNTFNIISWSGTVYNIVLPNGFYTQTDLQQYLQTYFLNNALYLTNSDGNPVFFLYISINQTYYANQLLVYSVPTSAEFQPTVVGNAYYGWTAPAGFVFPSPTAQAPALQVLDNNFQQYIGFNAGTYGGGTVDQSFLSQFAPNTTNINSLIVTVNCVNNHVSIPTNVIDIIPITGTFGSNIVYEPKFQKWIKVSGNSTYSNLIINILDQNFNPIISSDSNTTISLLLQLPKK